ncbi:hypothetical protein BH11MYX4_BH11MYX4_24120 [soil metagenome]
MSRAIALLCLAALACTPAPQAGRAQPTAATATTRASAAPADASPAVGVAVEMRGPLHARYDPTTAATTKPSLSVIVTNGSAQPVDVSDLHVHLEAVRETIAFRCAAQVGAPPGVREPSTLPPGQSFVFDRALDCALPLVGAYQVRVGVSFGKGPDRAPRIVRALGLTVTALPNVAPRKVEGSPGLWAALGASPLIPGGAGHGRTLLTIVNATDQAVELPPMRLVLRVYRAGNPAACEDEPQTLALPAALGGGASYHEPVEVSCLGLAQPGSYEVVARLIVSGGTAGDREIGLGRLHIDVVTDPSLIIAPRWRQ